MSTELMTMPDSEQFELTQRQAKMFVASGYFKDVRDVAQACVKMEIARALGLLPIQGLMGVAVIQGRISLEASIMGAAAKRKGYKFIALAASDTEAHIEVRDASGSKLGESRFTIEDAKRAGLAGKDNWKNYPADMLWARAMARACRRFCQDSFGGPVYVPDEAEEFAPVVEVVEPQANKIIATVKAANKKKTIEIPAPTEEQLERQMAKAKKQFEADRAAELAALSDTESDLDHDGSIEGVATELFGK